MWLQSLDASQLQTLVEESIDYPLASMTYEDAGSELAVRNAPGELGFGLGGQMWGRTKVEFKLLVCGRSSKYDDLRKNLNSLTGQSSTALVAIVSSSLATAIGAAATVIAPMVALLLLAIIRLGTETLCASDELTHPVTVQ